MQSRRRHGSRAAAAAAASDRVALSAACLWLSRVTRGTARARALAGSLLGPHSRSLAVALVQPPSMPAQQHHRCSTPQCCARHPRACDAPRHSIAEDASSSAEDDSLEAAAAAKQLRAAASWPSGDLAVSHTTGGVGLSFARNWWRHLQRAGVTNFALLATDDDAHAALQAELPAHAVRCPRSIVGSAAERIGGRGARYRSAGWTRLMFAVPAMVRWVLRLGLNVLWMDTDVVALSNPFAIIRAQLAVGVELAAAASGGMALPGATGGLMLASVDGRVPEENLQECDRAYTHNARWGRSAGGWKLCGGLFYLQRWEAALAFLRDWERRLRSPGAGAKNQPHYNEALRAATLQLAAPLRVQLLSCELFPNGFRYSSDAWRRANRRPPVLVHNNWIKGSEAKLERFQRWGLWLGEANASSAGRAVVPAS